MHARSVIAAVFAALLPVPAHAQGTASPFLNDAKAGATVRSMYFRRDLPNAVAQETWALAGSLWGHTGYWRDILAFSGRVYVDVPLYGPDDHDGGRLLKPGQDGFGVIAEANAKLRYAGQTLTLYRQPIGRNPQKAQGVRSLQVDLNYLGSNDVRMVPLTYEAAMLNGEITPGLAYQFGYVDKVKDINADRFVSMSRLAGVSTRDTGLWNGGLQWNPAKDLWLQAFYYRIEDTLRIGYADLDWVSRLDKDSYWRVAAQYSDQRSDGANLLTGSSFKSWNAGLYGEYGWQWLKVYGAASSTGTGQQMRNPFSYGPFYMAQRIKIFTRAGEDALMAGTSFDLASAGVPGFGIDLNVTDGRHAIVAGTGASLPKWREYDTDFVYRFPKDSPLSGARIRLRWATVREDFGTRIDRTSDTRVDFNWAVSFN